MGFRLFTIRRNLTEITNPASYSNSLTIPSPAPAALVASCKISRSLRTSRRRILHLQILPSWHSRLEDVLLLLAFWTCTLGWGSPPLVSWDPRSQGCHPQSLVALLPQCLICLFCMTFKSNKAPKIFMKFFFLLALLYQFSLKKVICIVFFLKTTLIFQCKIIFFLVF